MVRSAVSIAVGLDPFIARCIFARRVGAHAREQSTGGIVRNDVRADLFFHGTKMMMVVQHTDLDAVPLLAIDRVGFAAHVIVNAGRGHQIAFIGRIHKDLAGIFLSRQHCNGSNARPPILQLLGIDPTIHCDRPESGIRGHSLRILSRPRGVRRSTSFDSRRPSRWSLALCHQTRQASAISKSPASGTPNQTR